jgi:hypothetical protein
MNCGQAVMPDHQAGNNLKGPSMAYNFDPLPVDEDWEAVGRRFYGGEDASTETMHSRHGRAAKRFREAFGRDPRLGEVDVPGIYQNLQWQGHLPEHTRAFAVNWSYPDGDWLWYTPQYVDFAVWAWDQWLEKSPVRAAYFDDCWAAPQKTAGGPVSYVLPDGHVQPGWQFRRYRERFKRMRRACLDRGVTPWLATHMTHTPFVPYLSFFDVWMDGEDRYARPPQTRDFIDKWPPDRIRLNHCAKWGIVQTWLGWTGTYAWKRQHPAWAYWQSRAYAPVMALHELKWPMSPQYMAKAGWRDEGTRYHPYWRDNPPATWTGEAVRAGIWTRPGKCLVMIVNFGAKRVDATCTPDLARLGLAGGALQLRDVDDRLISKFGPKGGEKRGAPPVPGGPPGPAARPEGEVDPLLAEPKAGKHPDAALEWDGRTISCPVRPHDYRLLELRAR